MRFLDYFNKQGLVVLPSLSALNAPFGEDAYGFNPLLSKNWKTSDKRLLVVLESVDRTDIREGEFLNSRLDKRGSMQNPLTHALPRMLDKAIRLRALALDQEDSGTEFAFAATNFNGFKSRDLPLERQLAANVLFAQRVVEIIRRLKPTHILVCGDTATSQILQLISPKDANLSQFKRGWVLPVELDGHQMLLTPTVDLDTICTPPVKDGDGADDDSDLGDRYALADLLYFATRNIVNLLSDRHLYDLSKVTVETNVIRTIEDFDHLMRQVRATKKRIAIDIEGASLETVHNKVYTIQFCWDGKVGHIVPVDHPHESNPFTEKERRYIKKRLGKFFGEDDPEKLKVLVLINGMFDMRVLRYQLGIKFIHHTIYEVTAGESLLDENLGLFGNAKWYFNGAWVKTSYQNLAAMYAMYGNDWYYRDSEFGKSTRHTVGRQSLENKAFIEYAACDVISIWHIAGMQMRRASATYVHLEDGGAPEQYLPMFRRHLYNIMTRVCVSISHMESDGSPVDIEYLRLLMGKDSPLIAKLAELEAQFLEFPKVQEAEKLLMSDKGRTTGSLFGDDYGANAFSLKKKPHLALLFFKVLELPVVSYTKGKHEPAVDKVLIKAYAADHPEVKAFGEYTAASKLLSTYVKGWYKSLMSSLDSARDFVLRPSFGFFTIVTGRLNSFAPSLQQVPSRGPLAPIIHRMFVAPPGHLNIRWDYNAAEVRQSSVLSGDKGVASSFKIGQKLRRMLLKNPTDEIRKRLKVEGDVHLLNVKLFFKQIVDKSHPLRSAVKAVVFGVIYGKSASTLGRDLQAEEVGRLSDEERAIRKSNASDAEKKAKLREIKIKQRECSEKDWTEYAQSVIDKMFESSPQLKEYLESCVSRVKKYFHVVSPAGRVRNMWRVLTGRPGVVAAAARRGQNAPIQGFSSESGSVAAYETLQTSYYYIKETERDFDACFPKYSRAVHDANYFYVPYEFIIPFLHITQHVSALGLAEWYHRTFGLKFTIEPEIELEIGAHDAQAETWDWTLPQLAEVIFNALKEQVVLKRLRAKDLPGAYALIVQPWVDKEERAVLCEKFPLLGVKDLDDQIEMFLTKARDLVKAWKKEQLK